MADDAENARHSVSDYQRRNSPFSSPPRKSSQSTQQPLHTHFEPQTPPSQQHQMSSSPSLPFAIPRPRVNSVMSRTLEAAQSFTSPLAQIFQPLVVDDEPMASESQHPPPPPLVSFGPASRRRLSSMHQHRRHNTEGGGGHPSPPHKVTPTKEGHGMGSKRFPGIMDNALSESPPSMESSSSAIPTALQVKEGEAESGGSDRRLDDIERRQQRMEKLLEKIASSLEVEIE